MGKTPMKMDAREGNPSPKFKYNAVDQRLRSINALTLRKIESDTKRKVSPYYSKKCIWGNITFILESSMHHCSVMKKKTNIILTYKVGNIHNAILNWMRAVKTEFQ